jgi:urease accessory protein
MPIDNYTDRPASLLIDRAIGRLNEQETKDDSKVIDWVDVSWLQCARRALRTRSRSGRSLTILLRLGERLAHGDVLWRSPNLEELIALNVLAADVIIGRTMDAKELALLAFELGNLHVPIELTATEIAAPGDGPVLEAFEKSGIAFSISCRRFNPTSLGTLGGLPDVTVSTKLRIERK